MSIWRDIEDRAAGNVIRNEDFYKVYPGSLPEDNLLHTGKYKNQEYMIFTDGGYPYITIYIDRNLSIFAGAGIIKINDKNGQLITLDRTVDGLKSVYRFDLNRGEDYVVDDHNGKKYTIDMLEDIAKDIIEQILECEDNLENRID